MKDLCRKSDETRDALIEERKKDIIHQRMKDEECSGQLLVDSRHETFSE